MIRVYFMIKYAIINSAMIMYFMIKYVNVNLVCDD